MLTAALRDLHRLHPGRFVTDVRTCCPDLWAHNPWITPLKESEPGVRVIDCHYPLIQRANKEPWHFLHGYAQHLGQQLGVEIHPTAFRGDIHLSDAERTLPSPVEGPYWIIVAGGKYDFTIKWWHRRRWQEVVDHFRGRITFVHAGESGHYHPPLNNVIDMRGKTSLRELVRLVHHSAGVVCPVTCLSHLAAAVPLPARKRGERPCVVVAGGREPAHWDAYPWQRYLHTIGMLPCCASGGGWKARAVALGDDSPNDKPANLCVDFVPEPGLPKCMDMISSQLVTETLEQYITYA